MKKILLFFFSFTSFTFSTDIQQKILAQQFYANHLLQERNILNSDACGICKNNKHTNIYWYAPFSNCAHNTCFNQIKNIDEFYTNKFRRKSSNPLYLIKTHKSLILYVEEYLQQRGFNSIKAFHDAKGDQELNKIFNSAFEKLSQQ